MCDYPGCTKRYTDPSSLRKHKNNSHLKKLCPDVNFGSIESNTPVETPSVGGVMMGGGGLKGKQKAVKSLLRHNSVPSTQCGIPEGGIPMDTNTAWNSDQVYSVKTEKDKHSEPHFSKSHTDPGPATMQRVRNGINSYLLHTEDQELAPGRPYPKSVVQRTYTKVQGDVVQPDEFWIPSPQRQASVPLPVIQQGPQPQNKPLYHSTHLHPPISESSVYTGVPSGQIPRTGSNGSSIHSGSYPPPSPADSMFSSTSTETAKTYPGTRKMQSNHSSSQGFSLRHGSAVDRPYRRHTSTHPPLSLSRSNPIDLEHTSLYPSVQLGSSGGLSRHTPLPPLESSDDFSSYSMQDPCETLPNFSDVNSSVDMFNTPPSIDALEMTIPGQDYTPVQYLPNVESNKTSVISSVTYIETTPQAHLPSYSEAVMSQVPPPNMLLGDQSTHALVLPTENSYLEQIRNDTSTYSCEYYYQFPTHHTVWK